MELKKLFTLCIEHKQRKYTMTKWNQYKNIKMNAILMEQDF